MSALVPVRLPAALRARPYALGAEGEVVQGRVVRQTFTVYAPVLQSPTNLNKQVDAIVDQINAGRWEVTSFAVRSGDQLKAIPLLPKFLQPTAQIMKFVVRRRDSQSTSKAAAVAVVRSAAIKQGVTLQSFKDWVVEIREEIVEPSIPTLPKVGGVVCAAVNKATGLPCWVVFVGAAAVGLGVLAVVAYPYAAPFLVARGSRARSAGERRAKPRPIR